MSNGNPTSSVPPLTVVAGAANLRRWVLGAFAFGLIVYAYGISRVCMFQVEPRSLVGWLLVFWGRGGDYAHGYLVPVVAAGVLWWKWRTTLRLIPAETSVWGLVFV